jgi:SAM-dependent methyltransferase
MALDGSDRRLLALRRAMPSAGGAGHRLLVSGMGSGTEMLAGRRLGYQEVHGTEVDPFYVRLCEVRFRGLEGLHPHHYDGARAPFEAASFDAVVSGHIVEHTRDPAAYLIELVRVLKTGGALLVEFPTRFHWRELHTGLPSVEWLPAPLRNGILRFLGSRFSPFSPEDRRKCRVILETELKQVSTGRVKRWLRRSGAELRLLRLERHNPGEVRLVFQKVG